MALKIVKRSIGHQIIILSSLKSNKVNLKICLCTFIRMLKKHLGCKKGEANQKQQLSDYTCD